MWSQKIMRKDFLYKVYSILMFMLLASAVSLGQSKEELQKERDAIAKKIAYTKELLDKTKASEKSAESQLKLLDKKIQFRQQLISSINSEISDIEYNIEDGNLEITRMEEYLDALKEEYKEMIYQTYKNKSSYDRVMYIFASENFEQAYKRLKIMQSYAESRAKQADEIILTQAELKAGIQKLEKDKLEKEELLLAKKTEKENLNKDRSDKDSYISEIKKEQQKLDNEIRNQNRERERIKKAIRAIIEAETSAGGLALTPEGKIVSSNFEKNKGDLPWPVTRGIITQGFGRHQHKTLVQVYTDNNGVDITTDENAEVYAIFKGEVTSVFDIPGAGRNIIVTHGAYKTIYSNLKDVVVKKGDKIEARQKIAKVLSTNQSNTLHFELWKTSSSGSSPINPQSWISN